MKTHTYDRKQRWLLLLLAALYIAFFIADLLRLYSLSNVLKFAAIFGCLLLAFLHERSSFDGRLVILALFFTVLADFFLLFTDDVGWGMAIFCLAHLTYIYRLRPAIFLPCAIGYALAILLSFALVLSRHSPMLLIALTYAALLLVNTVLAFRSRRKNLIAAMTLFVLCDIHVAIYHVATAGTLSDVSYLLIWVFYLPSQVLLALSGE